MNNNEILPPSLIVENRVGIRRGVLLSLLLFLFILLPWLITHRDLFRYEGVFAAVAVEYSDGVWVPENGINAVAHHELLSDAWPLYPAVVSLFSRWLPMEMSLRMVSTLMLGILAVMAGVCAALRSNYRAGLVAALCCFGTLFALDKGVYGGPETMAACFLLGAQILFFHYGSRYADWNSAWISSAILLSLGFLTSGPVVILFFVFPLFLLRRPLSFAGKFRTPGFLAGVILLIGVLLIWLFPLGLDWRHYSYGFGFEVLPMSEYFKDILLFPFIFIVRMMPWTLIMWLPFCVALQAISPTPVFSRYLRTLFFSMLALVWLLPGASSQWIFFLIGPLAILTGINYDLGVRRYGRFLRRSLLVCGFLFPLAVLLLLVVVILPDEYIGFIGEVEKMRFRMNSEYLYLALAGITVLTVLGVFFSVGIKRFPIWVQIAILCFGMGVIGTVELLPYRKMERDWSNFGKDVREVLPEDANKIYKHKIDGMYCGLFYVGLPVHKLNSLDELDETTEVVYLISTSIPVYPDRIWTPLLPEGYQCRGIEVSVWRGELRKESALE